MTPEETLQARLRIATATAAAAVTVAIGMTLASIAGYFPGTSPDAATEPLSASAPTGASTPKVVLVPVQPAAQPEAPEDRLTAAARAPRAEWAYADVRGEADDAWGSDTDRHEDRDDERGGDDDPRDDDDDDDERGGREHEEHDDED